MRVLNIDDLGFAHPGGRIFMTYLDEQRAARGAGANVGASQRPGLGRSAMNYPLQALIQMGVMPPVSFPTDSRYYGSGTLKYTRARRADDHLSGAAVRAAAGRSELRDGRAAHRAAGRPAGPDRRQVSRRSAGLLAHLRRQWRDRPNDLVDHAGNGARTSRRRRASGSAVCLRAFSSAC